MTFILDLIFPTKCIGCEIGPKPICIDCKAVANPKLIQGFDFPIFAMANYEGLVEKMLKAYKDSQLVVYKSHLAALLQSQKDCKRLAQGSRIFVPPRNRANYRKRGFDPALELARKSFGSNRQKVESLKLSRIALDQRRLGRLDRDRNVSGAFQAPPLHNTEVFLFDDVLTTGATMREMNRSITVAGGKVIGACVLAQRKSAF